MARVELDAIGKRYPNGFEAVSAVSVDIADGEFIVLVGPSGCGKSTTLRMVAGLESITSGELRIGGRRVNDLPPKARDVAMVFQSYALYPHMTVFENMAFALKLRKVAKPDIKLRVEAVAARLDITELLHRRPVQMSGGQRQRVAMGRAIVREPQVFLFDEPLSNLDAKLRLQMRVELARLHRSLGATSLYVTHDQVEAMTLADRIVLLEGGVVQQIGAPLELYSKPSNLFVAGFIGSPGMNILEGVVQDGQVCGEGFALPAPKRIAAGTTVKVGVRPESLLISGEGFGAKVEVVEPLGNETYVYCECAGAPLTLRVLGQYPTAGDSVKLAASLDDLHFFDPAGGARI